MRCLVQRVSSAAVDVAGERIASIDKGLLVLAGVTGTDTGEQADYLAQKIINLRIFADTEGKMNLSALDINAEILVVSQFTLYGDTRKGRRPSFIDAAHPDLAEPLVARLVEAIRSTGLSAQIGRFGAEMAVHLVNDGPVTIWFDTADIGR